MYITDNKNYLKNLFQMWSVTRGILEISVYSFWLLIDLLFLLLKKNINSILL